MAIAAVEGLLIEIGNTEVTYRHSIKADPIFRTATGREAIMTKVNVHGHFMPLINAGVSGKIILQKLPGLGSWIMAARPDKGDTVVTPLARRRVHSVAIDSAGLAVLIRVVSLALPVVLRLPALLGFAYPGSIQFRDYHPLFFELDEIRSASKQI